MRRIFITVISLMLLVTLAACGKSTEGSTAKKNEITIGYFPNLTHITTIVGIEKGYFQEAFGKDIKIKTKTFTQGGLFMEALASNAIDIGTTGPSPVINFYVKDSKYHILSGSVNGGASLVARNGSKIKNVKDLAGKKVVIPGTGNTQDIMLRKELKKAGLKAKTNGGTVDLHPSAPADAGTLFKQNSVDAAALPEPWGYVLEEQGAETILDWEHFAWGKETPVTVVATSEKFMKDKKKTEAYLKAQQKALAFIHDQPEDAKALVIKHLKDLTGKELDQKEVDAAFDRIVVTSELNQKVIQEMADLAKEANYIPKSDIKGMVDLSFLQAIE